MPSENYIYIYIYIKLSEGTYYCKQVRDLIRYKMHDKMLKRITRDQKMI